MADNLLKKDFEIQPEDVYKYGPYLHSVAENFINNGYDFSELNMSDYINKLQTHLTIALTKEQEFYDLVGVADASEFSNKFLYGFDNNQTGNDILQDSKIIQKVLININSSLALISGKAKSKLIPTLEKTAKKIVESNPDIQKFYSAGENMGAKAIFDYLNAGQRGAKTTITTSAGFKKAISFPKRKLRSEYGEYVLEVLAAEDQDLYNQFKLTPQQKINKYKEYFIMECKKEGMNEELIVKYWERINKLLLSLKSHKDDKGNISAFSNIFGAEGALGEIAIAITLEDIFESKAAVKILANDVVTSVRQTFSAKEGVTQNLISKTGEPVTFKYKSPTDLLITVGKKVYPIQVKTTYNELTVDKALKLQGGIYLSTLLGNLVSQNYLDSEEAQLLAYTIANLSTVDMLNQDGINSKIDLVLRILQACLEYFSESYYARELSEILTSKNNNNMGNMFFIYSGKLIPLSSFIKAAIAALEGKELVIKGNYLDIITYKESYDFEAIKKKNLMGRINMGQKVYDNTKIKELSFIIAQMDERIKNGLLK